MHQRFLETTIPIEQERVAEHGVWDWDADGRGRGRGRGQGAGGWDEKVRLSIAYLIISSSLILLFIQAAMVSTMTLQSLLASVDVA